MDSREITATVRIETAEAEANLDRLIVKMKQIKKLREPQVADLFAGLLAGIGLGMLVMRAVFCR